jgi:hypothetical protein
LLLFYSLVSFLRLALSYGFPLAFLKSWSSDLHCPMFPLISSITQHQQHHSAAVPSQAVNQSIHPPTKTSSTFSGKQGGGATVLSEGHDIVTRETCIPTSLNINNRKIAVLHFASHSFLQLGPCQTQMVDH